MSTAELKINLINQIANIEDKVRLEELLLLLKFQSDDSVFITNSEDKKAIEQARNQVSEGKIITNSAVQKEVNEWLEK